MRTINASGNYACFTNPLNKAEKVSYMWITPSVAIGTIEHIF